MLSLMFLSFLSNKDKLVSRSNKKKLAQPCLEVSLFQVLIYSHIRNSRIKKKSLSSLSIPFLVEYMYPEIKFIYLYSCLRMNL